MTRAAPVTEAVEAGAGEEPIRSPIGSLRRAEAAACVRAPAAGRAGAMSMVRTGEVFAGDGLEETALCRFDDVCTAGLAKNGAG